MWFDVRAMKRIALLALLLAGCHHHNEVKGPVLLQSNAPSAWATVSLTVSGEEADDSKRDSCVEEATDNGIALAANAPAQGTLYFMDHDDYLESNVGPKVTFGAMKASSTCRLALGKLVKIDELVPLSKGDPAAGCKPTGSVEGTDSGFMHAGSYDAAVSEAQFAVHKAGGNKFVQDATRTEGMQVIVNGRGFHCQ